MQSFTKIQPINLWKNDFTGETISQNDFDYASHVWKIFGISDLHQFASLYCLIDRKDTHFDFNTVEK